MWAPSFPSESVARRGLLRAGALWLASTTGVSVAGRGHWTFALPTLDGDRFLGPADFAGPVLVNFWGRDCPPCVAELPRLQQFAQAQPGWTVLLVSTDAPADARRFLQQRGISLPALRAGSGVAGLMRSAGNRSGALPFSVAVHGGRICHAQTGEVSEADLERLRQACG